MAARSARAEQPDDLFDHAARLPELIVAFALEAMNFVVQSKVEETVRQWIGRADRNPDDTNGDAVLPEALMFALELAAFTPGLSGATAIDRLLRQQQNASRNELAALAALKQASSACYASSLSVATDWRWSRTWPPGRRCRCATATSRRSPPAWLWRRAYVRFQASAWGR